MRSEWLGSHFVFQTVLGSEFWSRFSRTKLLTIILKHIKNTFEKEEEEKSQKNVPHDHELKEIINTEQEVNELLNFFFWIFYKC